MPRRVAEPDAVRAMRERGAIPIEPFPGTQKPWRCRCSVCGEESFPRYNDVVNKGTGACNGKCRGARISARLRRDPAEAEAVMLANGWEPLEVYPGANAPWLARCAHCGAIKAKKFAHVERGNGGCTRCSGRDISDAEARAVMREADLDPLAEYMGSLTPWLCRCLRCNALVRPCYAKVKRRGHQCWSCRSDKIADALRLDEEDAVASMLAKDLEPLTPYPGSTEIPWKSRCGICGSVVDPSPTLHNIRGRQRGCARCAGRGIDPTRAGLLYVVVHSGRAALKWGIANSERRLDQHTSQGWSVVARWNFEKASDAWAVERQIKAWVRGRGIAPAMTKEAMKYRGYTETASVVALPPKELTVYVNGLLGVVELRPPGPLCRWPCQ